MKVEMEKKGSDRFVFDRTAFQALTAEEADAQMNDGRNTTVNQRLEYSYYLTARAYGFDPENRPKMDRTHFEMISRNG